MDISPKLTEAIFNLQFFLRSRRFNWILLVDAKAVDFHFAPFVGSVQKIFVLPIILENIQFDFHYNDLNAHFKSINWM